MVKVVPKLASRGTRLVAQVLDDLVALAIFCVIVVIGLALPDELFEIAVWSAFVSAAAYVLFSDGFTNGQSFGKRAFHIAVIDASTGEPCTFTKSLIRNLSLILLEVVDWIFIFGKSRQRLGDRAAHTIVVNLTPETYLGY